MTQLQQSRLNRVNLRTAILLTNGSYRKLTTLIKYNEHIDFLRKGKVL